MRPQLSKTVNRVKKSDFLSATKEMYTVGIETDVDFLICLEILFGSQDKDVATLCADA